MLMQIVTADKAAHPPNHTYSVGRVFGPTEGSQQANQMRVLRDLTGTGTATYSGANIYPELAYFVSMYVGRSPTSNRKVFVRKWIHPSMWKSSGPTSVGTDNVPTADKTFFKDWFEGFKVRAIGPTAHSLVTPRDQHVPTDAVAVVGPRLHIRQLKQ